MLLYSINVVSALSYCYGILAAVNIFYKNLINHLTHIPFVNFVTHPASAWDRFTALRRRRGLSSESWWPTSDTEDNWTSVYELGYIWGHVYHCFQSFNLKRSFYTAALTFPLLMEVRIQYEIYLGFNHIRASGLPIAVCNVERTVRLVPSTQDFMKNT